MTRYFYLIASALILGCVSAPESRFSRTDVDFMFNDYEVKSFDYAYGEYPKRIIDSILSRSSELGIEVKGITAIASGFHPVIYVIYTEENAYVSFFYWGKTAGKGYIDQYTLSGLVKMNADVYSQKSCVPYARASIERVDIHVFKKGANYIVCNEEGAIFEGGKIREYFNNNFDERLQWVKYNYGK